MRLEAETEHKQKTDAWIADIKDGQKERPACQEAATEANPEKVEPNPGVKEVVVEWQEIPKEEAAFHSLRACQKQRMSCRRTTETRLECEEPTSLDMESEVENREVLTEEAAVKFLEIIKKRHRGRHLPAGRRGKPKELTRGNPGSRRKLDAACRMMIHRAAVGRHRGHSCKGFDQVNVVQETRKERTSGKRRWKAPQFFNGIRNRGLR
jgi:hypothetical protein